MINIKKATTRELVEFYNDNAGKPVVKFRDRATAERRCLELVKLEPQHSKKQDDLEIIVQPSNLIKPASEGTKISRVIDALWEGTTESEVLAILGVTKKTKANTAKFNHWLRWNVGKEKGYGIVKKVENSVDRYYIVLENGVSRIPHKVKPNKGLENV